MIYLPGKGGPAIDFRLPAFDLELRGLIIVSS
jgi:hypothetical protein